MVESAPAMAHPRSTCRYFPRKSSGPCFINISRFSCCVGITSSYFCLAHDYVMSFSAPYPYSRCNVLNYCGFRSSRCAPCRFPYALYLVFVSFLGVLRHPARSHSRSILEVLLPLHSVRSALVVCRMDLSAVFLGVRDCVVICIALAVGVGPRFLVLLVRFLVVRLRSVPSAPVS